MEKAQNKINTWTSCTACHGRGKKSKRLRKKVRLQYQKSLEQFNNTQEGTAPNRPKGHLYPCPDCQGTGLTPSNSYTEINKNYPHIAIIGGGIGGVALAVACLHRGIPFTLYERDNNFNERSQGYGLTLQQASKAISGLGILSLEKGIVSTRHIVHNTSGKVIGEWGMRKWIKTAKKTAPRRTNIHISRQALRQALLEQLNEHDNVQWGHQLIDFKQSKDDNIILNFKVNGKTQEDKADVLVGADGIRSTVRNLVIGEKTTPLQYLGCIVILGICPLKSLENLNNSLLDSATVFQTANGNERIYVMPYDKDSVMWQLSFPISEIEAKKLSAQGPQALKDEAQKRTNWHDPIPQILKETPVSKISGYPTYDRDILTAELLDKNKNITLIGDAAHPMSPFKGQGANQALLDALALAREITRGCRPQSEWKTNGIRESVLTKFESEMLTRSTPKVKDSAAAAQFLHSEAALHESNQPRGKHLKD